ncbi:hypothetical protein JOC85_000458 [Bacillus mesophilus]|uniref:Thioredoxin n=1 Tax=Bacillus mesophilus TaxID=1808955 RepID=A0A6M0Q2M5_9BACI|nr:hypothetical protein [Bacillus mesophilus]MBM7659691.1 hypothetical protein [Bacillus mesophilus]NEY70557.1 hypothetical protein [Bacillus mesophilus]
MLRADKIETKDALDAMEYFYDKGWTDGFPVVPPTEERVKKMLESVNMKADTIVGSIPERGRVFTAELVAINAVMAGCLPGYFPIVMAAVQAISEPEFGLHGPTASTHGAAIMIAVNGPIAGKIGLNANSNALGPGNRANATIGRAIRLLIINVGGSPEFDRSTLGTPAKYSFCFAEKETDWTPLHVQRGFTKEDNTVTVFACEGPNQIQNHGALKGENILKTMADRMTPLGSFNIGSDTEMAVVFCPEHYHHLHNEGWTKESVQEFLFKYAVRSVQDLKNGGIIEAPVQLGDDQQFVQAVSTPEHLLLMVAGGEAGRFSACMPGWFHYNQSKAVTKSIKSATGFT